MIHRYKDGRVEADEYGVRFRGRLGPNDIAMTMTVTWRAFRLPFPLLAKRDGVWWRRKALRKAEQIAPLVATMQKANKRIELHAGGRFSRAMVSALAYILRENHRGLPAYLGPGRAWIGKKSRVLYERKVRGESWQ